MNSYVWNESYSVGKPQIDEQHKKLFEILYKLENTDFKTETSAKNLNEAFDEAVEYLHTHLSYEENLMQINNYPNYKKHKLEHDKFKEEIIRIYYDYREQDNINIKDLIIMIRSWIISHIAGSDKELGLFLTEEEK